MVSKYTVIRKLKNGSYAILSTISRGLIILNSEKYEKLCAGELVDNFTEAEVDYLIDHQFSSDIDYDEKSYLLVEMNRDRFRPKVFSTYIALSTLCNFSCVYCYEKGQLNGDSIMSEDTLYATIRWYKEKIISCNYTECNVCLYGGEPLLCTDLLKTFVTKMKDLSFELKVKLSFTMITNGYLLRDDICTYLMEKGLKEVQITLDGCKEAHDRRRMMANGSGTFDVIIKNIITIAKRNLKIIIRTSFDSSNINDIKELLVYLKNAGLEKRVLLYFAPIHQTETQKVNGCSFCSQHIYDDYKEIANYYCDLYDMSFLLGFEIPTCYTNGPCMIVGNDACLIAPNGDLYKCVEMIGKKELCIGNVFSTKYNTKYYTFMAAKQYNKCIDSGCIYAPTCAGGCAMESWIKNESLDSFSCHKVIFEYLNNKLISLKCEGNNSE